MDSRGPPLAPEQELRFRVTDGQRRGARTAARGKGDRAKSPLHNERMIYSSARPSNHWADSNEGQLLLPDEGRTKRALDVGFLGRYLPVQPKLIIKIRRR